MCIIQETRMTSFDSFFQHSLDRILAESILCIAIEPASFKKQKPFFVLEGWHQCPFIPDLNENLHQPNTCLLNSFQQTTIMWKTHQFPLGKISRIYEWIGSV